MSQRLRLQAGLTLVELMVALGISSVVVLATLSMTSDVLVQAKKSDAAGELAFDFDLLTDYFSREIPNAGGQDIPAQGAYFVENNCAARAPFTLGCQQSDRLTLATSTVPAVCSIQSYNAVGQQATLVSVAGNCCFTAGLLDHQQVLFTSGSSYAQKWIVSSDVSSCKIWFTNGPMSPNDDVLPAYDWTGGIVVPVNLETYYLDVTNQKFYKYTFDGATATSGTAAVVADRVADFQVALGYDFNPNDGIVTDNGNNSDEWLYNSPSESLTDSNFVTATPDTLKMIELAWILTAPGTQSSPASAKVLDGPLRSQAGVLYRNGAVKFAIKSTYLFQ